MKDTILQQCLQELKEVDVRTSVKTYLRNLQTFTYVKNKKFTPEFIGKDDCPHTPNCTPTFADKFQKIKRYPRIDNSRSHRVTFDTGSEKILIDRTLPDSQGLDF